MQLNTMTQNNRCFPSTTIIVGSLKVVKCSLIRSDYKAEIHLVSLFYVKVLNVTVAMEVHIGMGCILK